MAENTLCSNRCAIAMTAEETFEVFTTIFGRKPAKTSRWSESSECECEYLLWMHCTDVFSITVIHHVKSPKPRYGRMKIIFGGRIFSILATKKTIEEEKGFDQFIWLTDPLTETDLVEFRLLSGIIA
jgi:hypothetical protein